MFRFENPQYLYLLGVIPLLILLYVLTGYLKRRRLRAYGDMDLLRHLMRNVSSWHPVVKFALLLMALSSLVVALARPQYGTKIDTSERNGIEAVIAVDISNSMLARDVSPNRLEKSKMLFSTMMDNMKDDQVGIVLFAGEAFTQLPITNDYVSAKMFLDQMDPSMIRLQGTDIAAAIKLAEQNFTQREQVTRAIFLITDGEDNEGGAVEAAREAAAKGIRVYVLGVGSSDGATIPIAGSNNFMVDEEGKVVISKLNEGMCAQIAEAGKGAYIHVENSTSAQASLNKYLEKLQKTNLETNIYSEYDDQFQGFLLIALVCLILEVLLLERQTHVFGRKQKTSRMVAFILFMCMVGTVSAQNYRDHIRMGNRYYREKQFDKANVEYSKAFDLDSTNVVVLYNYSNTLMAMGDSNSVHKAQNYLLRAGELERNPRRKAMIYHNLGWLYQTGYSQNKDMLKDGASLLENAIKCYKESLRNNPSDDETRYNMVLCQRQLKKEKSGDNESQQQQQQQQQNQQSQQEQEKKEEKKQPSQQDQQPQEQKPKEDKQNEEQLLKAALQSERQTQKKIKKNPVQNQDRRLKKQW